MPNDRNEPLDTCYMNIKDLCIDWSISQSSTHAAAVDIDKFLYVTCGAQRLRRINEVPYDAGGSRLLYIHERALCVTASFRKNLVGFTRCDSDDAGPFIEVPKPQMLAHSCFPDHVLCATESDGVFEIGMNGSITSRYPGRQCFGDSVLAMMALAGWGVGDQLTLKNRGQEMSFPMAEFAVLDVLFGVEECLVLYANNHIVRYSWKGGVEHQPIPSEHGRIQWIRRSPKPETFLIHGAKSQGGFRIWELTWNTGEILLVNELDENWGKLHASPRLDWGVSTSGHIYRLSTGASMGVFSLLEA